ncbi:transposase [Hydrogenibacillus schlegelii]|uniref:transposase n=1 Tax=Hydrogenibacillus schlegelii TaxID=1484 RepID=UPI0034A08223
MADRLKEILQETAKERGGEIIAMEVMSDHVHHFASVPPKKPAPDVYLWVMERLELTPD